MATFEISTDDPQELWEELYARIEAEAGRPPTPAQAPLAPADESAETAELYASLWCFL